MNLISSHDAIAVIGMSGRFPASDNVAELWDNLVQGRTGVKDVTPRAGSRLPRDPNYVGKAATVEQADCFDAGFFGILPKLAGEMDPQHRLFLEAAWSALEDAGYRPDTTPGRVGVFAGCHMNTYIFLRLAADAVLREALADSFPGGNLNAEILNDKDYLATRVAFHLNLRGPAVAVQSACSTSLVAVAQACESLAAGSCDMALAGGACVTFPQDQGYLHTEDSIISPDGFCRTFDADAKGTIFGDGVGCVVLKKLSLAIQDGDPIYALIKGWGVNNDGADKGGYTAPSISGQTAAIVKAHQSAGITADTINYVEAHGTGTLVGDPIEVAALTEAFRKTTDRKQYCAIGSLKSNFGHLDVAAGVTAVIKVATALQNKKIPANLHFKRPNPKIDFENSPFFVQTALTDWPENHVAGRQLPRRAGVSSFGVGGTNAHIVMEEYIAPSPAIDVEKSQAGSTTRLFCLSAKSAPALQRMRLNLAEHLENHTVDLASTELTLLKARKPLPFRYAVAACDRNELVQQLRATHASPPYVSTSKLAMVFPGQGSQHLGMAQQLIQEDSDFAKFLSDAALALVPHVGLDLRAIIAQTDSESSELDQTVYAQPAIFMVSYALAKWLMHRGIVPDYLLGHSVGEFAAATIAGVMSLDDGARLIAARGRLMQSLPKGSMLAVNLSSERLLELLPPNLELAALNAPQFNVVAGPSEAIDQFEKRLESGELGEDITCRRLRTSHAFHSAMMDEAVEPFARTVEMCKLHAPRLPLYSTVTSKLMAAEEATSVEYWAEQIRRPVQFSTTILELLSNPKILFCEVGPNQALSTLIRQHPLKQPQQAVVPLMPQAKQIGSDNQHVVAAIGHLWCLGMSLEPDQFCGLTKSHRVHLPTYSFDRERHWFEISKPSDEFTEDLGMSQFESENPASQPETVVGENLNGRPNPIVTAGADEVKLCLVRQQMEIMQKQLYLLSIKNSK
jgi:phthiocerol/phenolphthiocerol synthesis type-I polyketide synthase E